LLLVDFTGRLLREGKASISKEMVSIFDRIGSSALAWQGRIVKLRAGRLVGRFLAASRARLRRVAAQLGVQRLVNLAGCPAA
jgi:hypothetical protein